MRLKWPSQRLLVASLFFFSLISAVSPAGVSNSFESRFSSLRLAAAAPLRPATALFYRAGRAVNRIARDVRDFFGAEKTSDLREKIKLLEVQLAKANYALDLERDKLRNLTETRRLLGVEKAAAADVIRYSPIPAAVVAGEPALYRRALVINRGSADGVSKGQGVLWRDIVVGRIKSVSRGESVVELVTDPEFRAVARVGAQRTEGMIEGAYDSCRLKYVPEAAHVDSGDSVVASGQLGWFPPGAVFGKVSGKPAANPNGFLDIAVAPAIDLARVLSVVVAGGPAAAAKASPE
jgi:rod shape-determining protein MreC